MIDYNFMTVISWSNWNAAFFQNIISIPFKNSDKIQNLNETSFLNESIINVIDELWNRIYKTHKNFLFYDLTDVISLLKSDVLMSLYVTLKFNTLTPVPRNNIIELIREHDIALKNKESAIYYQQNISHKKTKLHDIYQPNNNSVLLSGQLFTNNALIYLNQFWNKNELICFHLNDYANYIHNSSHWPFHPDNLYGMTFSEYFNGIRNMVYPTDLYCTGKITSNDLKKNLSFYILEELFCPVSFIRNLILHLENFQEIFCNYKTPNRELSMHLMQPLFKIPIPLWDKIAKKYMSSVKDYINCPNDLDIVTELKKNLGIIIYYNHYLFPFLKALVGASLYQITNTNSQIACKLLEEYIENNIEKFDYITPLKESMCSLAKHLYPTSSGSKIPVDIQGNYLYQEKRANEYPDVKNSVPPKGNEKKRNNLSIRTYEINFTYKFFCQPKINNYFQWTGQPGNPNIDNFCLNTINCYMNFLWQISSGHQTFNYLQYKAIELGLKQGTIIT